MKTAQRRQQGAPGAFTALTRFVLCGGGIGIASSFAVAALASCIPWILANALITVVSTLLATELHARFTFGAGGHATWRQHAQSAGSAAAAYAVTSVAMLVLHQLAATPGAVHEQAVYLSASALAGLARFALLRLVIFARRKNNRESPLGRPDTAACRLPRVMVPVLSSSSMVTSPAASTAIASL
ncbi:GtrA family protein [Streptomyces sp. NPDC005908]|uniref:GtrA family protein n=1 Tax=Streptomyces sp. NPDC005908 TaxID=3157084 RepID=UPI0033EEB172